MMREIKFRVWHPRAKYFSYWGFTEPGKGIFAGIPSSNEGGFDMEWVRNNSNQFTGLHDKNGREIYEGDVVSEGSGTLQGVIEWDSTRARFQYKTKTATVGIYGFAGEVIGNIYENPEMVKQ